MCHLCAYITVIINISEKRELIHKSLTIENNSSPNPPAVEFVQLFLRCHDSLVVKPTARRRHIRRRLFNVAAQGLAIQPRRCRFDFFSFFNPPFLKQFFFFLLKLSF